MTDITDYTDVDQPIPYILTDKGLAPLAEY